jgi:hypothetical protein
VGEIWGSHTELREAGCLLGSLLLRRLAWYKFNDVSVVIVGSIITTMKKVASTSETSVNFYQATRCNNPEDSDLQQTCHSTELRYFFTNCLCIIFNICTIAFPCRQGNGFCSIASTMQGANVGLTSEVSIQHFLQNLRALTRHCGLDRGNWTKLQRKIKISGFVQRTNRRSSKTAGSSVGSLSACNK